MAAPLKDLGPVGRWLRREGLEVADLSEDRLTAFLMAEAAWLLPDFVAFMDERGQSTVTIQAALAWVRLREDEVVTTVSTRRITAVRGFARYLSGIDADNEIPPRDLVPYRLRWRPPFLYSDTDIAALIAAAEAIEPPFRAATYRTLLGLLAASGLRIGEAIGLDGDDIDWAAGVLLIRESKFGSPGWSRCTTASCGRYASTTLCTVRRHTAHRPRVRIPCPDGCQSQYRIWQDPGQGRALPAPVPIVPRLRHRPRLVHDLWCSPTATPARCPPGRCRHWPTAAVPTSSARRSTCTPTRLRRSPRRTASTSSSSPVPTSSRDTSTRRPGRAGSRRSPRGKGSRALGIENFHDLLKARMLHVRQPLQILRRSTWDEATPPPTGRGRQDEASRAWNLHIALYYKAGGVPWRLPRPATELTTST